MYCAHITQNPVCRRGHWQLLASFCFSKINCVCRASGFLGLHSHVIFWVSGVFYTHKHTYTHTLWKHWWPLKRQIWPHYSAAPWYLSVCHFKVISPGQLLINWIIMEAAVNWSEAASEDVRLQVSQLNHSSNLKMWVSSSWSMHWVRSMQVKC